MNPQSTLLKTIALIAITLTTIPALGAVTTSGVIDPSTDPTTWEAIHWTGSGYEGTNAYIGKNGTGSMTITEGSVVENNLGHIGYGSGSEGTVTVDGSGSTWTNSSMVRVGSLGNGTVNITNGGKVTCDNATRIGFGEDSTGTVLVDGAGSTWEARGYFSVGYVGDGELTISNGGLVRIYGDGTLTIDEGGDGDSWVKLSNGGALKVEGNTINNGTVDIGTSSTFTQTNNSPHVNTTFTNNGDVTVGNGGTFTQYGFYYLTNSLFTNNGTVTIDHGGTFTNYGTFDNTSGTFTNNGTFTGPGTFVGNMDINAGTLAPGNSPGTMSITGDFILSDSGTLEIEIASLLENDLLDVTGTTTLEGGTIEFLTYDGYNFSDIGLGETESWLFLESDGGIFGFDNDYLTNNIDLSAFDMFTDFDFTVFLDATSTGLWLSATHTGGSTTVPVPSAVLLASLGLGLAGRVRRRFGREDKKRKA